MEIPRTNNMYIQQANPRAGYGAHKEEIDAAVKRVLEGGWYILGEEVRAFETEFAEFSGVQYAVGVASGTDAIELALRSLGIGSRDIVLTVSHTAVATIAAIERAGAIPYLLDIDPETYTLDPHFLDQALQALRSKPIHGATPKAVIPVHLYGHPADMDSIIRIAKENDLFVIEDCAQAHGAKINDQEVGSFGDIGTFSFYPTKNLGAAGDGGAVITSNSEINKRLIALRQYGWQNRYISSFSGINTRLDEIQAGILRVKLKYLSEDNKRRCSIAEKYDFALEESQIQAPGKNKNCSHVYHQYVVQYSETKKLAEFLDKNNIGSAVHYPLPVHVQPAYENKINIPSEGELLHTEAIVGKILSLPMYPQLSDSEVNLICSVLSAF